MNGNETEVSFREVQRFRQPWLLGLLLVTCLPVLGSTLHGMYQQLILGKPSGDHPMSDTELMIVGTVMVLFILGIFCLFYAMKLITEVRDSELVIRFFPLSTKTIAYRDIKSCVPRKYSPIREFGGWGIRFSLKGKAYNVSGARGVQLELQGERPLLIGSQHPDDLARAIQDRMKT